MSNIRKVGVIGAGQMGNGIAHVFAQSGFDVLLSDLSQESLDKGVATIEKNMQRLVGRGKMSEGDMADALGRITTSTTLDAFGDVDLAVESAVENEEIKRAIFEDLCPRLKEEAIIATNTSSIMISELAAQLKDPSRLVGTHWFFPANVMPLVEVARSELTAPDKSRVGKFSRLENELSSMG